jgi:signal transduction histidine kinase
MATVYKKINNKILELKYLNLAKDVAEQNGFNKDLISIYSYLSTYYEKSDVPLSLSFLKKHNAVKDSVFNETSNKQITELNTKYETSKKEQQLILQRVEIANKNYLVWAITGGTLLLTIAAFSFYRKKQAQNKMNLHVEVMRQQDIATKGIIVAEEKERKRIAADLHDGVGQMMSVAKMNLSAFENELPFKNEMQKNNFEKIINLVDESCKEIRSVSHQMMPNALLKSGLANAIKEFIDKLDSRILKVNLYTEGLNERLDSNIETVLYRIIQECVNNVIKHSGANTLDISLIKDTDGIAATIEDNGNGFDAKNKEKFEGIGLKNIISRVQFLKGTVDFDSSVGNGTLVAIHIPIFNVLQ